MCVYREGELEFACARVSPLCREGGTSITRYMDQRWRNRRGWVRARVVERQIVRHLTHLIPYLTLQNVTTPSACSLELSYSLSSIFLRFSHSLSLPLHLSLSLSSPSFLQPPNCRALTSSFTSHLLSRNSNFRYGARPPLPTRKL